MSTQLSSEQKVDTPAIPITKQCYSHATRFVMTSSIKIQGGVGVAPMDVDPIDDGPSCVKAPPVPVYGSSLASHQQQLLVLQTQQQSVTEEEARQFIEMLRSEDVSSRVAAANRLDAVAMALGCDRTRDVSCSRVGRLLFSICHLTFMPCCCCLNH